MKTIIYDFINQYVSNHKNENLSCIKLKTINSLEYKSTTIKTLSKQLSHIEEEDKVAYKNLLKLDEDNILFVYLYILKKYYDTKNKLQYSTSKVAREMEVPELAVNRFENLHNLMSLSTFIKIMKVCDLTIIHVG